MPTSNAPPVILLAVPRGHGLEIQLSNQRCAIVHAEAGARAREWARELHPDMIVIADELPDMTGLEVCRGLQTDPRIGRNIPTLILTATVPTPEQRVSAIGAGAWDFLPFPISDIELSIRLEAYAQAKRNLDVAFSEGLVDPTTGVHSRSGLARRARELGAMLARTHGALSCVVFSVAQEVADPKMARSIAGAVRMSDVVAPLEPGTVALLAPGTDRSGAVKLARRVTTLLKDWLGVAPVEDGLPLIRVGYEAVDNLKYSPLDPVELVHRAVSAVREGAPEPHEPWVRRSSGGTPSPVASTGSRGLMAGDRG